MAGEELLAEGGEGEIGFAGDDVVGEVAEGLGFGFVGDFRAAENDREMGGEAFEEADELGGLVDVPDVDA